MEVRSQLLRLKAMKTEKELLEKAKETGRPVNVIGDKTFFNGRCYKIQTSYFPNGKIKESKFYF